MQRMSAPLSFGRAAALVAAGLVTFPGSYSAVDMFCLCVRPPLDSASVCRGEAGPEGIFVRLCGTETVRVVVDSMVAVMGVLADLGGLGEAEEGGVCREAEKEFWI